MKGKELYDHLVANKAELMEMKKATKKTHVFTPHLSDDLLSVSKSLHTSTENDTETMIKRTIVGNTYNWLDSHGDVHVGSTFSKSIGERKNKIWHLHDHEYKLTSKVGTPTKIYEQEVKWRDLGIDKAGTTTSLFMETDIKKSYNELIFDEYKSGNIDQHSVGMYYVKLDLAINDSDYKEEKAVWDTYINAIGNKEKAIEQGYFWAVKEAKLIEISAVLEGSNELTPTIDAKHIEPEKSTHNNDEPVESTHSNKSGKSGNILYY